MDENRNNGGAVQTPPAPAAQPVPVPQPAPVAQPIPGQQPQPPQPGYPQQPYQQPYQQPVYQQAYQPMPVGGPMPPVKKKADIKKFLPLIIVGSVVALALIIFLIVYFAVFAGRTTVDLSKYYDIEVKGFNGYAKASVVEIMDPTDDEALQKKASNSLSTALSTYSFLAGMDKTFSKTEKISNGDTIELTFTYDEDIAKRLKLRVKNSTITKKVSGLEEGKSVDPFESLEVTFTGTSPSGKVTLVNNSSDDMIRRIRYSADKTSRLKNGDKIVVTASYDEDYALENGYIIKQDKKEYTVSNLAYYLDDKTKLSDKDKAAFEKEFKDRIDALLAGRWDGIYSSFGDSVYGAEKVSVGTPKLVKGYQLSVKDPDNAWSNYNKLVIIYQVEINAKANSSYNSGKFGKRTGYVAVQFSDAGISDEGVFVESSSSLYSGYKSSSKLDELETELVTAYKDNYIVTAW